MTERLSAERKQRIAGALVEFAREPIKEIAKEAIEEAEAEREGAKPRSDEGGIEAPSEGSGSRGLVAVALLFGVLAAIGYARNRRDGSIELDGVLKGGVESAMETAARMDTGVDDSVAGTHARTKSDAEGTDEAVKRVTGRTEALASAVTSVASSAVDRTKTAVGWDETTGEEDPAQAVGTGDPDDSEGDPEKEGETNEG